MSDVYTRDDREMMSAINDWLSRSETQRQGWTQMLLAERAGIARSTANMVLNGSYPHKPKRLLSRMLNVVREEQARYIRKSDSTIIETSVFRLAAAACYRARRYGSFAVLPGAVGTGKTVALKAQAKDNPQTYYVRSLPNMTASVLLDDLVEATGAVVPRANQYTRGTKPERLKAVIKHLQQQKDALLIIDEADRLNPDALEHLRSIRDEANVGILLSGNERIEGMLRGKEGRFSQIGSRVTFWAPTISSITRADSDLLSRASLGDQTPDEVLDALWQVCAGSARTLVEQIIRGIRDYVTSDGQPLTPAVVYTVAQVLHNIDTEEFAV